MGEVPDAPRCVNIASLTEVKITGEEGLGLAWRSVIWGSILNMLGLKSLTVYLTYIWGRGLARNSEERWALKV